MPKGPPEKLKLVINGQKHEFLFSKYLHGINVVSLYKPEKTLIVHDWHEKSGAFEEIIKFPFVTETEFSEDNPPYPEKIAGSEIDVTWNIGKAQLTDKFKIRYMRIAEDIDDNKMIITHSFSRKHLVGISVHGKIKFTIEFRIDPGSDNLTVKAIEV